jgi:hypothetical protein
MERKVAITVVLITLMLATVLLAASAQNEYCLPWQERVGHGDGVLGPDQDYTTCRWRREVYGSSAISGCRSRASSLTRLMRGSSGTSLWASCRSRIPSFKR